MNGCCTMSGSQGRVKINCRNHRLPLCFAHLIPKFEVLQEFDSLLLILFLMMKNIAVKTNILEEVQKAYGLLLLKLVKTVVTRWLSDAKACERILDRFNSLVSTLHEIYERMKEPAVRVARNQLLEPQSIAMLCLMADMLPFTNTIQTILEALELNCLEIPAAVSKLVEDLELKNLQIPTRWFY